MPGEYKFLGVTSPIASSNNPCEHFITSLVRDLSCFGDLKLQQKHAQNIIFVITILVRIILCIHDPHNMFV